MYVNTLRLVKRLITNGKSDGSSSSRAYRSDTPHLPLHGCIVPGAAVAVVIETQGPAVQAPAGMGLDAPIHRCIFGIAANRRLGRAVSGMAANGAAEVDRRANPGRVRAAGSQAGASCEL
jgi:hypothetical protein